jgi:ElaB/YqjD/DUF883 family membrane-anchored ribosome-binding protein
MPSHFDKRGNLMAETQQASHSTTSSHQQQSVEELREKFNETLQNLRDLGTQLKALSNEELTDLGGRVVESYERYQGQLCAWERDLIDSVRRNPFQALLIAAGLGVLAGLFWRRR